MLSLSFLCCTITHLVPAVGEDPAAAEQEEGAELAPADLIAQREAELQHIQQRSAAGQVAADNAAAVLALEQKVLEAVVQVSGCSQSCCCSRKADDDMPGRVAACQACSASRVCFVSHRVVSF
jgi:hypothetical protein